MNPSRGGAVRTSGEPLRGSFGHPPAEKEGKNASSDGTVLSTGHKQKSTKDCPCRTMEEEFRPRNERTVPQFCLASRRLLLLNFVDLLGQS